MKKYLVGIDGGGTKSQAVLTDLDGTSLAAAQGSGLNPLIVGWEKFGEHFRQILADLLENASRDAIKALCAGLAGV